MFVQPISGLLVSGHLDFCKAGVSGRSKERKKGGHISLDLYIGKAVVLKTSSDFKASSFFPALAFFF